MARHVDRRHRVWFLPRILAGVRLALVAPDAAVLERTGKSETVGLPGESLATSKLATDAAEGVMAILGGAEDGSGHCPNAFRSRIGAV